MLAAAANLESFVLARASVSAWLASAKPGCQLVYARMTYLSRTSPTVGHMRELADLGLVRLNVRRAGGALFDYIATRRALRPAAFSRSVPRKRLPTGDMTRVLRVLRTCASLGRPCPNNRSLAKAAGVRNASYQLQKLIAADFISSELVDPVSGARVIRICSTGKRTAMPTREINHDD